MQKQFWCQFGNKLRAQQVPGTRRLNLIFVVGYKFIEKEKKKISLSFPNTAI